MREIKKILVIATVLLFCNVSEAQIFILDDGSNNRSSSENGIYLIIPDQGVDWDQYYAPLGDGALLLAALGGAYLLGKKKKK